MNATTTIRNTLTLLALTVLMIVAMAGCEGRPTIFPNPDPQLRKTSTQLAADAAKRHPYPADAPRVKQTQVRAQVAYSLNRLEVLNFSGSDWDGVEVWVNRKYVCYLPTMQAGKLKEVHFPMLYDDTGRYFPFDNRKERVESVELYRDGTVNEIVCGIAD
jgi:hypothetical protein